MKKLFGLICILLIIIPAAAFGELTVMTPAPAVTPTPAAASLPQGLATPKPTMIPDVLLGSDDEPAPTPVPTPSPTPKPTATPAPTAQPQVRTPDGSFPELNSKGFLDEGEFIFKDVDKGIWRYCSSTLKVEIKRLQTSAPKMCWYEAEIWSDGEAFHMLPYSDKKPMSTATFPYKVARKNYSVFAVTTDYAHSRLGGRSKKPGIIIRNGVIYSDKTRPANSSHFPNLDVLAMYPDGNMEVYASDAHTAQEYLDMGVESTLAFGPIMVQNGEINPLALTKYGRAKNPRMAIGMIEKGHYIVIMVEGRSAVSSGITIPTLTNKMAEKGCVLAFNLDGGGSACMTFMGNQITRIGDARASQRSARSTADLVSIGQSLQVPYDGDK